MLALRLAVVQEAFVKAGSRLAGLPEAKANLPGRLAVVRDISKAVW